MKQMYLQHAKKVVELEDPEWTKYVHIKDVAVGLKNQIRLSNCEVPRGYNVLNHSIYLSEIMRILGYSPHTQLYALLHDCEEAFSCDIAKGFKAYLGKKANKRLRTTRQCLIDHLTGGLIEDVDHIVAPYDAAIFYYELLMLDFDEDFVQSVRDRLIGDVDSTNSINSISALDYRNIIKFDYTIEDFIGRYYELLAELYIDYNKVLPL